MTSYTYDVQSGTLDSIVSGTAAVPNSVFDLTYTYDANGRVLTKVDAKTNLSDAMGYDELGRLTNWTSDDGAGGVRDIKKEYYFNLSGTLNQVRNFKDGTIQNTMQYIYGDVDHPHAPTKTTAPANKDYYYDKMGRRWGQFNNDTINYDINKIDYNQYSLPARIDAMTGSGADLAPKTGPS